LKTLRVRMEEHQRNSLVVGRWLESHPAVLSVRHPGLPSHPQHELVKRQCCGHSGMISFYLKGGLEESRKLLSSMKVSVVANLVSILKSG
jgi:cystathionine gamma-lyase